MEPFATTGDLENRYPVSFGDDESRIRAETLLGAASRVVRQRIPQIDERTDLDFELVTDVVCEMVWVAVAVGIPGTTQSTQSVGSVSVSASYEAAVGRLRLTKAQIQMLRPARASSRASSISSLPPLLADSMPASETPVGWPYGSGA